MRMLDRKLLRDLRRMWAQALAIALVMASGVATFVLASGAYHSLDETRAAYYLRYRFADVFAEVRRAPKSIVEQIETIPGVAAAEPRISQARSARCGGSRRARHRSGRLGSGPGRAPRLNLLHLREGRLPERERTDEVTVNEGFAKAHGMASARPSRRSSTARSASSRLWASPLSPEFIYALGPGDLMPDDRRFAVLWMSEKALAGLFDLDGAFNDVTLSTAPAAPPSPRCINSSTQLLARYGGTGAYGRKDQLSHAFLDAELRQLDALRRVMPPIFLLVSAFLINITLSRMVALEREQIGLAEGAGLSARCRSPPTTSSSSWSITAVGIAIGFARRRLAGSGPDPALWRFLPLPVPDLPP